MRAIELLLERSLEDLLGILRKRIPNEYIKDNLLGSNESFYELGALQHYASTHNLPYTIADNGEDTEEGSLSQNTIDGIKNIIITALWNECDPTPNHTYINWLVKAYIDEGSWLRIGFYKLEDFYKVKEDLEIYDKVKKKKDLIPEDKKDISKIPNFHKLAELMRPFVDKVVTSASEEHKKEELGYFERGEAKLIYNDKEIKIVVPKTEEASCFFGRNTRWCTAARENNYFNRYKKDGPLYIVLIKANNERYQFQFGSKQFMDEMDHSVKPTEIANKYPKLWDIFGPIAEKGGFLEFNKNPSKKTMLKAISRQPSLILEIENPTEDIVMASLMSKENFTKNKFKGRESITYHGWVSYASSESLERYLFTDALKMKAIELAPQTAARMDGLTERMIDVALKDDPTLVTILNSQNKVTKNQLLSILIKHPVILDGNTSIYLDDEMKDIILKNNPDAIRYFGTAENNRLSDDVLKYIAKIKPEALTIYKGPVSNNIKSLYKSMTGRDFRAY